MVETCRGKWDVEGVGVTRRDVGRRYVLVDS